MLCVLSGGGKLCKVRNFRKFLFACGGDTYVELFERVVNVANLVNVANIANVANFANVLRTSHLVKLSLPDILIIYSCGVDVKVEKTPLP